MRPPHPILAILVILACIVPAQPLTSDFPDFADNASHQPMKWSTKTIRVSLSTSLGSPSAGMKPGSDVRGAVHRALSRWSMVTGITFEEVSSKIQSISSASDGDGISLITMAETPENLAIFGAGSNPARTRVFYDAETGEISEADIAINPHPMSADGAALQFSTDGTPGTYDLESTITHELGHLLGLEHSSVRASTMQAHQGLNGVYKSPAFTERTLSEDDRVRARSLYGSTEGASAIEGRLISSSLAGAPIPLQGAHVWVEDRVSGRLIASTLTSASGNYQIESIPPGQYRVFTEHVDSTVVPEISGVNPSRGQRAFRSAEINGQVRVGVNATRTVNYVLVPPHNAPPMLRPRLIGTNGELSTTPLPAESGKRLTVYVGGDGVDQVPISGISVTSPFMTIDTESLTLQQFGTSFPVIGFEVTIAPNATFGDYSIRLQSNSGEVAFVPGGITIDPGVASAALNPLDDPRFLITQHYRDFLGREPDPAALDFWTSEIGRCGSDQDCVRVRRLDASAAFFKTEFQATWSFIYRVYRAAFGRRPTLSEFNSDRIQIAVDDLDLESAKRNFVRAFVLRPEFIRKYSSLKSDQFVDLVLSTVERASTADLTSERSRLAKLHDGSSSGRAEIIQAAADHASFAAAEDSGAFVLMHYFGYLRREPEKASFNFWLNIFKNPLVLDPTAPRLILCTFIASAEYQSRFGMFVTHTDKECKQ